ncbi:hypothetical protein [Clostridium saccharobutylicum]|uniref:Uncharacterized protein n=1 Tax=Clostridium saccharobutylicum DSM 13864 TaxID=1345695 RepID=U5MPK8_CLOSA|nr:hypothetical protein [Clostridium saccharobutylicum]AGX42744.1 hypothetical protein CLSA_c17500 [Clostridium saccharobutylicum DSM 13864]AQR90040.1 hypothetical protein CLOSC_17470 [Clostridium saccharobutylicum]AQR99945.1 hypothetical protein CSACC_17540 [Clostridium saccharobutylicum]AQS09729.1 hypothetical protein CLOBY_18600 [Clostridium saccharobutylicum]AQS13929.1 hypothetical protein CLOSACC_17540 [Clostridium saccharobutylicum]
MKLKSKKSTISIVLYVVAAIIAILGIILLINSSLSFKDVVTQYTAKGYPADTVLKKLIPAQFLPQICEIIAMYGGIAFILVGIGIVNKKVSKCLTLLTKDDVDNDNIEEKTSKNDVVAGENAQAIDQTVTEQDVKKV